MYILNFSLKYSRDMIKLYIFEGDDQFENVFTIKQSSKVQDLQEFSLPHESPQWSRPPLSQNLHPLQIQLQDQRETHKQHFHLISWQERQFATK